MFLASSAPLAADYLEVDRKAPIRKAADSDSPRIGDVSPGDHLALLDDGQQQNGYYRVQFGSGRGWIYRTWVRRHHGDSPSAGSGPGVVASAGLALGGGAFALACQLPFLEFAQAGLDVDASCPAEGTGSAGSQAQNRRKNEFCAKGPIVPLSFANFTTLQAETDKLNFPHGHNLPEDRSPLRRMATIGGREVGEGTLVRIAAFVMKAHHSNVSKGETVNCKLTGKDNNDVHTVLMEKVDEDRECDSLTAEITPHFRPWSWEPQYLLDLSRPMRFTGHLFYDAAHRPCRNGKGSPKRAASWEVHPVYGIDVCESKTLAQCPANDDSKWTPLQVWHNLEEEHDEDEG